MLKCPICGKGYETIGEVTDAKRLIGHLTGKHKLKGEAFQDAFNEAIIDMIDRAREAEG